MGGGEAVVFLFLGGVTRAPEGAEGTKGPAGAAGGAVATRFERFFDVGELAEVEIAVFGVNFAMAGFASGGDTVEGVGAHFSADEDVVGVGETEEMAGFVRGEFFVAPAEDFAEVFF